MSNKMSDEDLNTLIQGLEEYAQAGVYDPWILNDGRIVQPLDVLKELKALRALQSNQNPFTDICEHCGAIVGHGLPEFHLNCCDDCAEEELP